MNALNIIAFGMLLVCLCTDMVVSQLPVTSIAGKNTSLQCTKDEASVYWEDGGTRLYTFDAGTSTVIKAPTASDPKYDNFDTSQPTSTQFNLDIQYFEFSDTGTYLCRELFLGDSIAAYTVNVEVTPSSPPAISHAGNGSVITSLTVLKGQSYDITCNVDTVYPETLKLVVNGDVSSASIGSGDYFNLSNNYTLTASKDVTELTCRVAGYVNQDTILGSVIATTVTLDVQYQPSCTLTASEKSDDCTQVTLSCDCDASPAVANGGYMYYYINDTMITNGNGESIDVTVPLDSSTEFYCIATNDIGESDQAAGSTQYDCSSSSPVVIIVVVVVIIVVLVIAAVVGYFVWKKKKGSSSSSSKGKDTHDGNGSAAVSPSGPLDDSVPMYSDVNSTRKEPTPAPRSTAPPATSNANNELQYADIDHGTKPQSNIIHQPEEPTQYASVGGSIMV